MNVSTHGAMVTKVKLKYVAYHSWRKPRCLIRPSGMKFQEEQGLTFDPGSLSERTDPLHGGQ